MQQLDRLEQVREFARSMGLSEQLDYLANHRQTSGKRQCVLGYDFAPHSRLYRQADGHPA